MLYDVWKENGDNPYLSKFLGILRSYRRLYHFVPVANVKKNSNSW